MSAAAKRGRRPGEPARGNSRRRRAEGSSGAGRPAAGRRSEHHVAAGENGNGHGRGGPMRQRHAPTISIQRRPGRRKLARGMKKRMAERARMKPDRPRNRRSPHQQPGAGEQHHGTATDDEQRGRAAGRAAPRWQGIAQSARAAGRRRPADRNAGRIAADSGRQTRAIERNPARAAGRSAAAGDRSGRQSGRARRRPRQNETRRATRSRRRLRRARCARTARWRDGDETEQAGHVRARDQQQARRGDREDRQRARDGPTVEWSSDDVCTPSRGSCWGMRPRRRRHRRRARLAPPRQTRPAGDRPRTCSR